MKNACPMAGANSEECLPPPPAKKARVSEAIPTAQPHDIAGPAAKEINVTSPFALQHALPAPLIAAPAAKPYDIAGPAAQNHEVTIQHALPGPSGTQAQTDYANVSIFSYLSISSNVLVLFNPNTNLSLRDINPYYISKCNFLLRNRSFLCCYRFTYSLDTIETQNAIPFTIEYYLALIFDISSPHKHINRSVSSPFPVLSLARVRPPSLGF